MAQRPDTVLNTYLRVFYVVLADAERELDPEARAALLAILAERIRRSRRIGRGRHERRPATQRLRAVRPSSRLRLRVSAWPGHVHVHPKIRRTPRLGSSYAGWASRPGRAKHAARDGHRTTRRTDRTPPRRARRVPRRAARARGAAQRHLAAQLEPAIAAQRHIAAQRGRGSSTNASSGTTPSTNRSSSCTSQHAPRTSRRRSHPDQPAPPRGRRQHEHDVAGGRR